MKNNIVVTGSIRSVAIVGSGLSGLTTAIRLREKGLDVTLFEKSRGPGGRLAARRLGEGAVDIGAQYFTIRSSSFRQFLETHAGPDTFSRWTGRLFHQSSDQTWEAFHPADRFVGVPRMTAISRALSRDLLVHCQTRIARIANEPPSGWRLFDTEGTDQGAFDAVILAVPPVQARELLAASDTGIDLQDPIYHDLPLQACWTVVAHFSDPLDAGAEGLSAAHPIIQWAANNSSKPGRQDSDEWWVLHARADWSEMHQHASAAWVAEHMLNGFGDVIGRPVHADEVLTHRWLYAKTTDSGNPPGCRWYPDRAIGLCGDWLSGGRVEGAFESAEALVQAMGADTRE